MVEWGAICPPLTSTAAMVAVLRDSRPNFLFRSQLLPLPTAPAYQTDIGFMGGSSSWLLEGKSSLLPLKMGAATGASRGWTGAQP